MSTALSIGRWLAAAEEAANEVALCSLACSAKSVGPAANHPPAGTFGAYIPMLNDDDSVDIGLVASDESCQALARAFLGVEPEEEPLPEGDVADGIAEITNMIAGVVQRILATEAPGAQLGLPMGIRGRVVGSIVEWESMEMAFGEHRAEIVVLRRSHEHRSDHR
jgi:hypothetical protein